MIREKTAIIESLKMWIWLYHNPGKGKTDYPKFSELYATYEDGCLCCAYYDRQDNLKCEFRGKICPLDLFKICLPGKAFMKWAFNHNHKPAAAFIASKLRRYARKKGWAK